MDRDKALSKIRKCLALGRSSNPHEAAAAMRQAQRLMAEHGLDQVDVDLQDVGEAKSRSTHQAIVAWETVLGNMIAEAFGCETFCQRLLKPAMTGYRRGHALYRIFVGVGASAEVAKYSFDVLSRQCAKARLEHIRRQPRSCKQITLTARGDAFAMGWVNGVRELVQRFAGNEKRTELLAAHMARHHPELVDVEPKRRDVGRNVRGADSWLGAEAARKATLNPGIGGTAAQELLS